MGVLGWVGGFRGDNGHLDICQPLMKEFNLVENLKQSCLTGSLTGFNSTSVVVACVHRSVCVIMDQEGGIKRESERKEKKKRKKLDAIKSATVQAYFART